MRYLQENLDDGYVLLWMDFAENYICISLDEVQSAYWTSEQVNLHTCIAYFSQTCNKAHKSVVGISDLNIHKGEMVIAYNYLVPCNITQNRSRFIPFDQNIDLSASTIHVANTDACYE